MKIVLKGHILVPADDLAVVKEALADHIRLTREELGCICFEVTADHKNPNRFDVYEEFRDRTAFELHQKRVSASYWGEVTKNVSRHYEVKELASKS